MSAIARFRRAGLVAGLLSLVPAVAFAHPGHGGAAGHDFLHGFMHPLHGMDHFLAMVAVGLWAAQRDRRSVWALPIAFVAFMAVGFVLGAGGVAMPAVELLHGAGIALAVGLRHAVMARSVGIERAIGAGIAAAGLALLLV